MTIEVDTPQFAQLLSNLSPTGDLWSTETDTVRMQWLAAFAATFQRLNDRANFLVVDAFPATTEELLPEWEASLGLPDPCSGPDPTIAERRAHVVAKLIETDGPSIPSLTAFALSLGYIITIEEFAPFRADVNSADDPVYEPEWAFVWRVSVPVQTVEYFSADVSYADDPLLTSDTGALQCELQRLSPAHTVLQFIFTGVPD
jgi:uncharacterized protein YmfQ (DUF2313 family)